MLCEKNNYDNHNMFCQMVKVGRNDDLESDEKWHGLICCVINLNCDKYFFWDIDISGSN